MLKFIYIYVTRFEKEPGFHTLKIKYVLKWIAGSKHYYIPLHALLRNHESGFFCGSLSQTLCKP